MGDVFRTSQVGLSYAGMAVDSNSTPTTVALVNSWFLIDIYDTNLPYFNSTPDQANGKITVGTDGDYNIVFSAYGTIAAGTNKEFEYSVFRLSPTTTAVTNATQADPVVITAAGHGLSNGDMVAIKSVAGMVEINDRIFQVAGVSGSTFQLQDNTSTGINGTGFTAYSSGGTVQFATETKCHTHRKYSTTDVGSFASSSIATLSKDEIIELYLEGVTDTTNFIVQGANVTITRIR